MITLARLWPGVMSIARQVTHGYANNHGLKTHFVMLGQGPLVILIHGIPEFWYSWRHQLEPLAQRFQVAAIDQRGFNQSDRPADRGGYAVSHLVEDVAAVIRHLGRDRAIIVGHDSGAWVAWHFAAAHPELTEKLVVLSVPHPNAFAEELAHNPAQHAASTYARQMQTPGAKAAFRVGPVGLLRDPGGWPLYLSAEVKSDPNAIVAFYQLNYPRAPYPLDPNLMVAAPTLVIHGQHDQFLLATGHARNARWTTTAPTTLLVEAGHFVHQESPQRVNEILLGWL